MYTPHTDLVGVEKIFPDDKYVVLKNGRKIEYD